jgi:HSP20 family molecular chaperone IbpA
MRILSPQPADDLSTLSAPSSSETRDAVYASLEVPAWCTEAALQVTLADGELTVFAMKKRPSSYQGHSGRLAEHTVFSRRVLVHRDIDEQAASATIARGFVTIRMPKVAPGEWL